MPARHQPESDEGDFARPIVTFAVIAILWALYFAMAAASHWHFASFSEAVYDLFGEKQNSRILVNGHIVQWWRFITPIFLHSGLMHILVNSYSLYILGKELEPFYGSRRYLIVFMAAGVAGVAASFRFSSHPSLGASGAIFGLVGAGIVFPLRFRSLVPAEQGRKIVKQLVGVAVLNLAFGFMLSNLIDNSAHVGGLLGGGFAALFLLPDALDTRPNRRAAEAGVWAVCVAAFGVTCAAGILQANWATGPWWRITLPSQFHTVGRVTQFEGKWRAADGSEVDITDTVHNPNLQVGALLMLRRNDIPFDAVRLNGWTGRAIGARNAKGIVQLYLVVTNGRVVLVTFHSPVDAYITEMPTFERIIKSLRFLHAPPPDLHPVPLARPATSNKNPAASAAGP